MSRLGVRVPSPACDFVPLVVRALRDIPAPSYGRDDLAWPVRERPPLGRPKQEWMTDRHKPAHPYSVSDQQGYTKILRLKNLEGCPSGQREQTVNLPADAFEGSNPSPSTNRLS